MNYHKNSYKLIFISTFIDLKHITNLIDSVLKNNHDFKILFIIINQINENLTIQNNSYIDFHVIKSERISLSLARNIGINFILKNKINFDHIMFPDDDTTFSEEFFINYKTNINQLNNYLIDVYCNNTTKLFVPNHFKNSKVLYKNNYINAMSVNIVINFTTFKLLGFFDERIGVGTKYGAGEDYDYFIRACNISKTGFIYNKKLFNFHPSSESKFRKMKVNKIINKYIIYGNGVIYTLFKHKMYFSILKTCLRPIGGTIMSIFKFNFKLIVAYFIAFFSRILMLLKCIINSRKLYSDI